LEIYKYNQVKIRPKPDFIIETGEYVTSIININRTHYVISKKNILEVWDFNEGIMIHQFIEHTKDIGLLLRIPNTFRDSIFNGFNIVSSASNGEIIFWDLINYKPRFKLQGSPEIIFNKIIYSENKLIAYDKMNTINIWDCNNGNLLNHVSIDTKYISDIHLIDKNRIVLQTNNKILILDLNTLNIISTLEHKYIINSSGILPDGKIITASGEIPRPNEYTSNPISNKTLNIWDPNTYLMIKQIETYQRINHILILNNKSVSTVCDNILEFRL